jgi:hypothetical protein
MICRFSLLVAALVAGMISPSLAADPAISAAETSVRLGLGAGYGHYEENITPKDTEAGALLGLTAGVSALTPDGLSSYGLPDLYTEVNYNFAAGYLNYRGNLQNAQATPYQARDNGYYNTAIVRLGLGAPLAGGPEVIPYLAGGYQNWYRNVGGDAGYGEFYQAGLIGGGLRLDVPSGADLVVSAAAEGFAVIGGSIRVPSQDFGGNFGTSVEERVSLDADYRLTPTWHAFAGLGLTHYGYTGSKPGESGAFEPLSSTVQVNTIFGVAYGF